MSMTEDWKTWPEPSETSVVLWGHQNGEVRLSAHDGAGWYHSGGGRWRTWPQVLAHIAEYGDGTPPRVVDLAEPERVAEPEHVVVWKSGDPIDKLKPYIGQEGVEVLAERDGTVVVGPLKNVLMDMTVIGPLTINLRRWTVVVTAPKLMPPWWLVDHIEPDHVVSWTDSVDGRASTIVWCVKPDVAWWRSEWDERAWWRSEWDERADPATWRVTDVHAQGGPKLIAGVAAVEEERA